MRSFGDMLLAAGCVLALAGPFALLDRPAAYAAPPAADVECTGCVDTTDLADSAVTAVKLGDGAVTGAKIGTSAVDASKIQDGAVTAFKLSGDAVFAHTLVVRSDGLPTENCDAVLAALDGITDNSEINRYLILLDAGVYDCGSSLSVSPVTVEVKSYVTLQGAGRFATKITSDQSYGLDAVLELREFSELRDLTIEMTAMNGANALRLEPLICGAQSTMRATNLAIIHPNPLGQSGTAVLVNCGSATLTHVAILPAKPDFMDGVWSKPFATTILRNVTTAGSTALYSSGGVVNVYDSILIGRPDAAIILDTNGLDSPLALISTQIDGRAAFHNSPIVCVGSYDQNFIALPADCGASPL